MVILGTFHVAPQATLVNMTVLTKVVLTKSMMHQLSKTVSNVSQLFLDHFITFCKETTYFQVKVVLKIG